MKQTGFAVFIGAALALSGPTWAADIAPDLDGDGKGDAVQIVSWEGPPLVTADLSTSGRRVTLMRLPTGMPQPEITVAPPGKYENACMKGYGTEGQCTKRAVTLEAEGVMVSYPEESSFLLFVSDGMPDRIQLSD